MPASAKAAISPKKLKTVGLPLLHPYKISKGEGSTYFFATDYGLKYSAYFIEYSATIHKVYSFSFDKEEGEGPHDERVQDSIVSILHAVFINESNILGYTCDGSDGRQLARKILFNRWFDKYNDGRLKKFDFQTDNVYVSLIINKDYFAIDEAVNDISQLIYEVLALK